MRREEFICWTLASLLMLVQAGWVIGGAFIVYLELSWPRSGNHFFYAFLGMGTILILEGAWMLYGTIKAVRQCSTRGRQ